MDGGNGWMKPGGIHRFLQLNQRQGSALCDGNHGSQIKKITSFVNDGKERFNQLKNCCMM